MKRELREKVFRAFMGSLLSSDFSLEELIETTQQLAHDTNFLGDLAIAVMQTAHALRGRAQNEEQLLPPMQDSQIDPNEQRGREIWANKIYELVRLHKLNRSALLRILNASNTLSNWRPKQNIPIGQVIYDFSMHATMDALVRIVNLLEGKPSDAGVDIDSYLDGIIHRRRPQK